MDRPALARTLAQSLVVLAALSCTSAPTERPSSQGEASAFPAWFQPKNSVKPSPELFDAAALLCSIGAPAREGREPAGPAVYINSEVRNQVGLYDGQLTTAVVYGHDVAALRTRIAPAAESLFDELGATHAGFAEGQGLEGERCVAAVGSRRLLDVTLPLPARVASGTAFPLDLVARGPFHDATLYVRFPSGSVKRRSLVRDAEQTVRITDLVTPFVVGRYVLEVLVDERGGDPEVALLWPFRVGDDDEGGPEPPYPAVLFGDEGHGDLALTHRAEALVQRLRTEQEIKVLKVGPALNRVAERRADALRDDAALGHRRPGVSALEDLSAREPDWAVVRIAEVQAQAGTLEDAWKALLRSPAHRYELVEPEVTHFGVAVRRGKDGADRTLISLVVLLALRQDARREREFRTELTGRINLARHEKGLPMLRAAPALEALCQRLAQRMADQRSVDENALGKPIATLALEETSFETTHSQVAALDHPLRLHPKGGLLDPAAEGLGIGLVPEGAGGRWMICVLVGAPEGGSRAP